MQAQAEIGPFRHPYTNSSRRKVPLPMPDGLRVAQLSARALLFGEAQFVSFDNLASLREFRPQVLLGSTSELETVAQRVSDGSLELPSLERALFVITDCRDMPIRDRSRALLWRTFGLPIFELLLGSDGTPIASECDAHEGWHIEAGVAFSTVNGELWFQRKRERAQGTGLTGDIDDSVCPCGKPGKRLLNAAMDYRDPVRRFLAKTA